MLVRLVVKLFAIFTFEQNTFGSSSSSRLYKLTALPLDVSLFLYVHYLTRGPHLYDSF